MSFDVMLSSFIFTWSVDSQISARVGDSIGSQAVIVVIVV